MNCLKHKEFIKDYLVIVDQKVDDLAFSFVTLQIKHECLTTQILTHWAPNKTVTLMQLIGVKLKTNA
jgi:hypothetical protein